jgi:hypothetical protein
MAGTSGNLEASDCISGQSSLRNCEAIFLHYSLVMGTAGAFSARSLMAQERSWKPLNALIIGVI